MNEHAVETLTTSLIGPVPKAGVSFVKGAVSGAVAFFIFEFMSKVNANLPRVPVSWLMMVAIIAVETVLLFRLMNFLRFPRTQDFMFVARLDYPQRLAAARYASKKAHTAFIPFTGAALAVAAVLEAVILKERSLPVLVALPCITLFFMAAIGVFCRFAISKRWIAVAHRDMTGNADVFTGASFFRKLLARYSVAIARRLSGLVTPRSLRTLLMRNLLYLLRGEIVLTILLIVATPVLLFFLLLLLGDPRSPFISFLPLLAVFVMSLHLVTEFGTASDALPACHWISVRSREVVISNFLSLMIPSLLVLPVYFLVTIPTLGSPEGIVRGVNELVFFTVTVAIGAFRASSLNRRDQDGLNDLLLFAGIAVGTFIPWAGGVFAVAVAGVLVLLNWELIQNVRVSLK